MFDGNVSGRLPRRGGVKVVGQAEDIVERVDGLALEAESDVGVDAGGDADVGVAEEFPDDDEFDSLLQEQGRGRVSEVVEADAAESGLVEDSAEVAGEVCGVKGVPPARAAARWRSVSAARFCLRPRWRRPSSAQRAVSGK